MHASQSESTSQMEAGEAEGTAVTDAVPTGDSDGEGDWELVADTEDVAGAVAADVAVLVSAAVAVAVVAAVTDAEAVADTGGDADTDAAPVGDVVASAVDAGVVVAADVPDADAVAL